MCLAQGHNTACTEWGSNPRPLDPESEALTTRPPRSPWEGVIFCWVIRGNYATKSTVAECVKRLCLGCVDELLAAFLEFPGVDGEAGGGGAIESTHTRCLPH